VKEKLQLNRDDTLYQFFNLFGEHFSNSIGMVINKPIIYELEDGTFLCDSKTLIKENLNKVAVNFEETENSIKCMLIFDVNVITALADLMLMGTGEGSDNLDDDLKDAIKELVSQGVSSVNVPFQERFENKVSFNVTDVNVIEKNFDIDEEKLIVQPVKINYDDKESEFYLAISENIKNVTGVYSKNTASNEFEFDETPDFNMEIQQDRGSAKFDGNIDMLLDVEIPVSVRIGSTRMFLKDIVGVGPGNIIELDNYADEPVELLINNKPIARGEVVIVDGFFGIRIKEIISKEERLKKLRDK
jgi:flagellar motor switch protein FliN/FliY